MKTGKQSVIRLAQYKNVLHRLKAMGIVKVFSDNLADATGVTSAQVRKDFSQFAISGNKRSGYHIDELLVALSRILGKDQVQEIVLAGVGNIGTALLNYRGFEKENIRIIAAFDIDPAKIEEPRQIPIMPLEEMKAFIKERSVKVGIISVPDSAAQQVFDLMADAGIKGVLNFAPIHLKGREGIIIEYLNLGIELEKIIYFVNTAEEGRRDTP